jgi:hypothetical protein
VPAGNHRAEVDRADNSVHQRRDRDADVGAAAAQQ